MENIALQEDLSAGIVGEDTAPETVSSEIRSDDVPADVPVDVPARELFARTGVYMKDENDVSDSALRRAFGLE